MLLENLRAEMEEALAVKWGSHSLKSPRRPRRPRRSGTEEGDLATADAAPGPFQEMRSTSFDGSARDQETGDNLWTSVEHSLARLAFEARELAKPNAMRFRFRLEGCISLNTQMVHGCGLKGDARFLAWP